ncbi:4'-phosphopantetheinyl transferase family protein [Clostridium hydrogenum]|uniref:4'-phosphopantetheinyl transferase family protein n=1 Tax=Clostridium hydrogenum TaxID=2855764 RepID=UPI001F3B9D59|nr:4'-phosphopantetheinyl transferase superfamily protein [Clostridium hydrogenum]
MEVYAINIDNKLSEVLKEKFLSYISLEKKDKINRFRNEKDMLRGLISDVLIRGIICSKLQMKNYEIIYEYNKYGKPTIKNNPNFHFNISHSGKWVAAAIDDEIVGIDIEEIHEMEYLDISKRFFDQNEYRWLLSKNDSERAEGFFRLWTAKESYVKLQGKGLSIPLNSFPLVIDSQDNTCMRHFNNENLKVYFKTHKIDENYVLTTCSKKESYDLNTNIMSYDKILELISMV